MDRILSTFIWTMFLWAFLTNVSVIEVQGVQVSLRDAVVFSLVHSKE